jgi:hypothetical protein
LTDILFTRYNSKIKFIKQNILAPLTRKSKEGAQRMIMKGLNKVPVINNVFTQDMANRLVNNAIDNIAIKSSGVLDEVGNRYGNGRVRGRRQRTKPATKKGKGVSITNTRGGSRKTGRFAKLLKKRS